MTSDGSGRDQGCLPLGLNSHEAEVNISKPFGPRSAGQMSDRCQVQSGPRRFDIIMHLC